MSRKVVITGIGAACAVGTGAGAFWQGLVEGRTGLGPATRYDASGFRSRLAGEIKGLSAKDALPKNYRKAVKVMARDTEIAVIAAGGAVSDAGLLTRNGPPEAEGAAAPATPTTYPGARIGCHIGAGLIAAETEELTMALATATDAQGRFSLRAWGAAAGADGELGRGGMNNLPPLWMLKYLPNMLACHVTILHGAEGPSNTITCNEASGLLSLGESARVIERDAAEACFSGSAESKLNLMGLLRISLAERLADTGAEADGSSLVRPFDPAAPGSVLGEGGGILIVEEAAAAARRGARAYAEVAGFGSAQSLDLGGLSGESVPGSPGDADALADAIEMALADAGVDAADIDAVVPHGAGVRALDDAERAGLERALGARAGAIEAVTLAPLLGECMAGNGGLMAAAGALCLHHQMLPARVHHGRSVGIRADRASARAAELRHVLVCTGSLGGQAAAVVLRRIGA